MGWNVVPAPAALLAGTLRSAVPPVKASTGVQPTHACADPHPAQSTATHTTRRLNTLPRTHIAPLPPHPRPPARTPPPPSLLQIFLHIMANSVDYVQGEHDPDPSAAADIANGAGQATVSR